MVSIFALFTAVCACAIFALGASARPVTSLMSEPWMLTPGPRSQLGLIYNKHALYSDPDDIRTTNATQRKRTDTPLPLIYHNGPLMLGCVDVYLIFYGNLRPTAQATLIDFVSGLGGSKFWAIQQTYYEQTAKDGPKAYASDCLVYKGHTHDNYSQGKDWSSQDGQTEAEAVVLKAINGGLSIDRNAVYVIAAAPDVQIDGFCSSWCGYHAAVSVTPGAAATKDRRSASNVAFAVVGNPETQCPFACGVPTIPINDAGADAMVSVVGHELGEATSDPFTSGWFDADGQESADKCAWQFGRVYDVQSLVDRGKFGKANIRLGHRDFHIQMNWVNAASGGFCSMHYP